MKLKELKNYLENLSLNTTPDNKFIVVLMNPYNDVKHFFYLSEIANAPDAYKDILETDVIDVSYKPYMFNPVVVKLKYDRLEEFYKYSYPEKLLLTTRTVDNKICCVLYKTDIEQMKISTGF